MILTKACKTLTHLGPSLRAQSHSFDQETILTMSAMSLVPSFLLHFSRRRDLSFLAIWSICLIDGLSSSPDSGLELEIRSECVKLVLRFSSSSRHSWMRQTDSMSLERATRVLELIVSDESVIQSRKQSFLVKQSASADLQSITIIEAVLEYHAFWQPQCSLAELTKKRVQSLQ